MISKQHDRKLFLLDAYALIFRGYYAFIKNPRINSKGLDTSAILGFTNALVEILSNEKPTHIGVCFDVGKTVRHDTYSEYKANRDETPEAIKIAVPYIYKILEALNIPILFKEGYEADDVIGTLAKKAEKEGFFTYMMTPDKDFAQLVSENIFMYKPSRGKVSAQIWGIEEVKENMGVGSPKQVIDLLGMMGDSADNIPGLKGIGPKTAQKFLAKYGSIENLFEHTDELKGKQKENVENGKEIGLLSKELVTIITDVAVDFKAEELLFSNPNVEEITALFKELEFRRILKTLMRVYKIEVTENQVEKVASKKENNSSNPQQLSLFDLPEGSSEIIAHSIFESIENTSQLYQVIDTPKSRELLFHKLQKQKLFSFALYQSGNRSLQSNILGVAFSWGNNKAYYIPLGKDYENQKEILKDFKFIFESETSLKIGFGLKKAIKLLHQYGIELKGELFDISIANYLLNPDTKNDFNVIAENSLNYQLKKNVDYIGKKGKNQKEFTEIPIEEQAFYLGEQADLIGRLYHYFAPKLTEDTLKIFKKIEMPLLSVLAVMEIEGIYLDVPFLKKESEILTNELEELQSEIYKQAGTEFNIASPKQLGEILFDVLELDSKAKKTKTGQYKTGEEILVKLKEKHPIIPAILQYRQWSKLKSTYVDALPKEVNPKTKRLHTTFEQAVAATGRLSSVNPNLQNIPIRTERGQRVRKSFIVKDDNHLLVAADYSQIELRLIAELSQDKAMMEAFLNGEDIHKSTAAKLFDISKNEVTRTQRSQAKTVNFGIIYGVSAFGLSEQTGLSRKESKTLIEQYYKTYPTLKDYMDKQVAIAREQGWVSTLLGRKRILKDINSRNSIVRGHAERNAVNAPIQGTAADIIKLAMIAIQKRLKEENLKSKMLLQVHDELVFEVPKEELNTVNLLIKNEMENAYQTKIPLKVEVDTGNNWLEAH